MALTEARAQVASGPKGFRRPDRAPESLESIRPLFGWSALWAPWRIEGHNGRLAVWSSIVQRVVGNVTPVHEYEIGTRGPSEAGPLAANVGGWHVLG